MESDNKQTCLTNRNAKAIFLPEITCLIGNGGVESFQSGGPPSPFGDSMLLKNIHWNENSMTLNFYHCAFEDDGAEAWDMTKF